MARLSKTTVTWNVIALLAIVTPSAGLSGGKGAANANAIQFDAKMAALADEVTDDRLTVDPFIPLSIEVTAATNDRLPIIHPRSLREHDRRVDALITRLNAIDPAMLSTREARRDHAVAREMLEADKGLRVCRNEQWSISHMQGWTAVFPAMADLQPVGTMRDRSDAIARWTALAEYIDADIANNRLGLAAGRTVPRSVVVRVLAQVEGLLADQPSASPFYSPAARSDNVEFRSAFATLIANRINPAIRRYQAFLRDDYLPKTRQTLSLLDLPRGHQCYDAWLRFHTTIDRPGEQVAELGKRTVARNTAEVQALGLATYKIIRIADIITRVRDDPSERFASKEEIVAYNRAIVARSEQRTRSVFSEFPEQRLEVRLMSSAMDEAGTSSNYLANADTSRAALYMLRTGNVAEARRSSMEITAVHEGYPGHHLQMAYAASLPASRLSRIAFNSAYVEGWARYAEQLAEELGLLASTQARIARRIWPARGMVADPGLHLGRWSQARLTRYLVETGRFTEQSAQASIDRMAVMPGQQTAYDSGGLEFTALRTEAQQALGSHFDLRTFHAVVLSDGIIPLTLLRKNVREWIEEERRKTKTENK